MMYYESDEPYLYMGDDDDDIDDVDEHMDAYDILHSRQLKPENAEEKRKETENFQIAQQNLLRGVSTNADEVSVATGTLYNDKRYSDVTLFVGERKFHAHRLVLSAWSDVFKTMLCNSSWQPHDDHSGIVTTSQPTSKCQDLVEDECCEEVFGDFLQFFYTASVYLTKGNVLPLTLLADKYLVKELRELCDEFIRDIQNDIQDVVTFVHSASRFGMPETVELCLQSLLCNFSILTPEQLLSLEREHLGSLLDSGPRLIVEDEYNLFKKIEPWLDQCENADTLLGVIKLIRFPYMNALQLKKARETPAFRRAQEIMPDILLESWQHQALYKEESLKDLPEDFPWPRLYLDSNDETRFTDQKVGSSRVHVENKPKEVPIDGGRYHVTCVPWKGKRIEQKQFFKQTSTFRFSIEATRNPHSSSDVIIRMDTDEDSKKRLYLGIRLQVRDGKGFYFFKCLPPVPPVVHRSRFISRYSGRVTRDIQFTFPSGISKPERLLLLFTVILEDEDEKTT